MAMLNAGVVMEEKYQPLLPEELSWTEKFNLIEAELKKDPARSDGFIAKTIGLVSKASVYRVREVLVSEGKVPDIPVGKRVSVAGKLVSPNGASDHSNRNGNRIIVPPGKTILDVCREGIEAEEDGMLAVDVARLIGLGIRSYTEARAIYLLSEKKDLSPSETLLVKEAVDELIQTRRTSLPYKKLENLVDRVWGKNNPRDRKSAKRRQDSFSHAMTIVIDTCMAAPSIHIPYLSNEERVNAVRQVEEALSGLRKLKRKIIQGRYENE